MYRKQDHVDHPDPSRVYVPLAKLEVYYVFLLEEKKGLLERCQ